ncbi:DUF6402 family protein [Burkholderia sp. AU42008]|uniref:DUF6402 family protein n=1 Tax=unclassified Burkholderia TaxID=2613784 RepID=UPI000B7AB33E|nr:MULTISPECIES: DUF6402 family protein [unclassified Burkholderia]MBR8235337.1 hypothetical protein [Burkholderia sp. AU32357]MBY4873763.1 DUF6402 family protein [Burkholderia sp. AU42008]OXI39980.1 hypothetical protein CFB49_17855 [Burkholderia sp. AU17457]
MPFVKKVPYYQMEPRLLYSGKHWKCYSGVVGCVPIDTQQKISFTRLAPNEQPLPPPPKVADPVAAQKRPARPPAPATPPDEPQPGDKPQDAEQADKLPEFDLQDIPNAMDREGWPISAKLARKWLASPKHVYNNKLNSPQPIDGTTVTLEWVLRFRGASRRFKQLVRRAIYTENAAEAVKNALVPVIDRVFAAEKVNAAGIVIDTTPFLTDLLQFYIAWRFQFQSVSSFATLDGAALTDLTAALGNFNFYAAVGKVTVTGERYYKYEGKKNIFCFEPVAQMTHIYVYIKDSYSFNDDSPSKSQYLGHWNRNGMVLSYVAAVNDLFEGSNLNVGNSTIETERYLPEGEEVDKPIDKRTGRFRKFRAKDVYWPVHNKTYRAWRSVHNRGGDFMVYSKPKLIKLDRPVVLKIDTVCRTVPAEQ